MGREGHAPVIGEAVCISSVRMGVKVAMGCEKRMAKWSMEEKTG